MIPGKKYLPEDYLRMAWRRKWMILLPWVVISSAVLTGARFLPNLYRSDTLIQIVPQRLPDSYVRSTVSTRVEDRLQSLRQQILNRTRLERLIDEFKLYPEQRGTAIMEDLVQQMRDDINIEIVRGEAFRVSYISEDPRQAMKVTEKLASMVIEENLRDRESMAEGANQFFETQLEDARQRLVAHEKTLEEYRRRYAGELPSQLDSNLQVIQNAQMQIQALTDSANRDADRRLGLERLVADLEAAETAPSQAVKPVGDQAPDNASAAVQLEAARNGLLTLELRLKADHPDIVRMKRVIRDLEAKAALEAKTPTPAPVEAPPSPADTARRARLREAQAELENLGRQIAYKRAEEDRLREATRIIQRRVDVAPTRESELIALTRDYDTLETIYTNLLAKKEDTQISANLERRQIGEQFKVLDPARMPEKPFSPNLLQINLLGILAGLAAGLMLAALVEYFDTTLRTDDDVFQSLALPVLATVPLVAGGSPGGGTRRRWYVLASAVTALGGSIAMLLWRATW